MSAIEGSLPDAVLTMFGIFVLSFIVGFGAYLGARVAHLIVGKINQDG